MSLIDSLKKILADEEAAREPVEEGLQKQEEEGSKDEPEKQEEPVEKSEAEKPAEDPEEKSEPEKQEEPVEKTELANQEEKPVEVNPEIEELRKQNEELQKQLQKLSEEKATVDAKARIDAACAAGWLTPAMLDEGEGKESVFAEIARTNPELFSRFALVMAPKILSKEPQTEAPVGDGIGGLSDEEKYNKISNLAKERGISYADAARLFK